MRIGPCRPGPAADDHVLSALPVLAKVDPRGNTDGRERIPGPGSGNPRPGRSPDAGLSCPVGHLIEQLTAIPTVVVWLKGASSVHVCPQRAHGVGQWGPEGIGASLELTGP